MKFNKWILGLAACLFIASAPLAGAQSVTNNIPSFFDSWENYMTTFDPAYGWTNVTMEAATGYKQVSGVNAASTLDAQYDFGATRRWNAGLSLQFSGVGSAFNAGEIGGGYALVSHYDTKVDLDLLGGYDQTFKSGVIEPQLMLKKKMTVNTFSAIGISIPERFRGGFNSTPTFKGEIGFTF